MSARTDLLPTRYANPVRVASGGMGEIYVAEDEVLGRKVAIKLLAERFARDESVRRRFTREALAAARLSGHPHIVTIFDVGEADGRPFIVMEYLAGGTLADRARRKAVSHDSAIEWLKQAAEALDDAHEAGIVHRDVKPANMLLDERGDLHVADFGIARVLDETTTGMTMAGTILGTAGYLSPEQARGDPASAASDIYSLAVVAYELLTGGRPFQGGSATAEAAAHIHQPVPSASQRGVRLPKELDAVFERALAKDPARRYATARDFVRALCLSLEAREHTRMLPASAAGGPATARTERAPAAVRVAGSRRRSLAPILAAVGLAALALTGVALAVALGRGDDAEPTTEAANTRRAKAPKATVVTQTVRQSTTVVRVTTAESPPPAAAPPATPPPTAPPASPPASGNISATEAASLNNRAFTLMQQGRYREALPLAQQALAGLRGSGRIDEAYANYNVGRSLIELGRCSEGLPYIARSERLQGSRPEFATARAKCY